jgi:NAD(P)-dependent dehydrogenase (short-subunit alcohol dehydrogenase family)
VSDQPLQGRWALLTGASRGIGASIALALGSRGAHLLLVARDRAGLDKTAADATALGARVHVLCADLSDAGSVEQLVTEIQQTTDRLDILVNNAGILPEARRLEKTSRDEWTRVLELNLTAPWYLACRAKEMMASGGGGVIVNIASTAAFFPSAGLGAYNVSKAGLIMLTKVCALEWAKDNVRVLGLAPGKVATDMVTPIVEWTQSQGLELNPLGRIGEPAEIADLVAYLVSDGAAYMTGITVVIDGGELLTSGR